VRRFARLALDGVIIVSLMMFVVGDVMLTVWDRMTGWIYGNPSRPAR
jgi:hypothetical protein